VELRIVVDYAPDRGIQKTVALQPLKSETEA
jgi:hypothetical protein